MRPLLQVIDAILMELHQRIINNECTTTEDQERRFLNFLHLIADKDKHVSKYEACRYLGISRAKFDRMVHDGQLPKGKKAAGLKELSWSLRELDDFLNKACYY